MSGSIIDAAYFTANARPTQYMLHDREIYADEIYAEDAFLPPLARLMIKRLDRIYGGNRSSGLLFVPDADAMFGEVVRADTAAQNVYPNAVRLSTLLATAEEFLGLGKEGYVDITPFYELAIRMIVDDATVEDFSPWPPYLVLPPQ